MRVAVSEPSKHGPLRMVLSPREPSRARASVSPHAKTTMKLSPATQAEASCTSAELPGFDPQATWPTRLRPVHSFVDATAASRPVTSYCHIEQRSITDTSLLCHASRRLPMYPVLDAMRRVEGPRGQPRVRKLYSLALAPAYPARQLSSPDDAIGAAASLLHGPLQPRPPGSPSSSRTRRLGEISSLGGMHAGAGDPRTAAAISDGAMDAADAAFSTPLDDIERRVEERRAATVRAVRRNLLEYPLPSFTTGSELTSRPSTPRSDAVGMMHGAGPPPHASAMPASPRGRDRLWQVEPRYGNLGVV